MTASEFADEIRQLGGRFDVRGGDLYLRAPKGVLKPEHREALATFKPELVELVRAKQIDDVLQALISIGVWKTTRQIAQTMNLSADDIHPVLEELLAAGTIERDGGPIWIWQANIEERLRHHGAIIAIDRETREALPLFKAGDADIVRDVADVYLPFEVELTPQQRADLTRAINRYEAALERQRQHTTESQQRKE
jgi:hypothetical protein